MPRNRTELDKAFGKLTSAIQKEWIEELGTTAAQESEQVMYRSQELAKAAEDGGVHLLLSNGGLAGALGGKWVELHPSVEPAIAVVEAELAYGRHA